ncbi:MAG TPA: peptide-methionine (S)-S-oxide reductase MsrA, partial [Gammaproteobacteria bacterium]|nr:peptide-methionine (S)-S-oxide reductase MsrA [Gammaproteobacteria bacterium]
MSFLTQKVRTAVRAASRSASRIVTVAIVAGAFSAPAALAQSDTATAVFAGGCFWCMEPPFDKLDGVVSTTSGYTGGDLADPTYEQVSAGTTGHYEAVRIEYDTAKISYSELLDVFWRNVDPLDAGGQFCDRGDQYRAAVFYSDPEEERLARASKRRIEEDAGLDGPVVTEILPASTFYAAEDYHQNYYEKNPI